VFLETETLLLSRENGHLGNVAVGQVEVGVAGIGGFDRDAGCFVEERADFIEPPAEDEDLVG